MDLLFKRYTSPFPFMGGMIATGHFSDFIDGLYKAERDEIEEKALWEFYLHKVTSETSFNDFKENLKVERDHKEMSERAIETTLNESINILNNFNPERGEDLSNE